MPTVMIYDLDSDGAPVTTLELGNHVFGRGSLLKCMDCRVSRYHGVIKVTEDGVTITSTHMNPCFYQSSYNNKIIILPQNNPVQMRNGDKFALLSDQFWFRVSIVKDTDQGTSTNSERNYVRHLSETVANAMDGIDKKRNIGSDSGSNSINLLQASQQVEARNDNIQIYTNSGHCAQVTLKREIEDEIEPSSKKLKLENEDVENGAEASELLSVLGDLKRKELLSDSDGELNTSKALFSESDSEDNVGVKIKGEAPKMCRKLPAEKSKLLTSTAVVKRNAELEAMLFSSDDDDEDIKEKIEKRKPKQENQASCSSKTDPVLKDSNVNSKTKTASTKEINKGANGNNKTDSCDADGGNNPNADQDANVAGPSSSDKEREFRDHCWYGLDCYRRNSSHLAKYSHPGDSDYESDPNDHRPLCSFGAACYRRSKDHRRAYKHPKPSSKTKARNENKYAKVPNSALAKLLSRAYSEDEEDPYIDSGSEYEPTTSSNDSDSDCSKESKEDENTRGI